jgi:hypothetical protein
MGNPAQQYRIRSQVVTSPCAGRALGLTKHLNRHNDLYRHDGYLLRHTEGKSAMVGSGLPVPNLSTSPVRQFVPSSRQRLQLAPEWIASRQRSAHQMRSGAPSAWLLGYARIGQPAGNRRNEWLCGATKSPPRCTLNALLVESPAFR